MDGIELYLCWQIPNHWIAVFFVPGVDMLQQMELSDWGNYETEEN